jgi:[acyl-carrier-protein] S-malonyltransferase
MGKELAAAFPEARATFAAINDALGFKLSRVIWEGPEDLLTRTDHAQPAILAHSAAVWAVVGAALRERVAAAAGHSLGEYSAYVAAGTFAAADAARIVHRRGQLMLEAGTARAGTMAAVMGLDAERVIAACREARGSDGVVVAANLNAPDQTVISGDPTAVARAAVLLVAAGAKRVVPLKVSGAFHSPLMAPAEAGLAAELEAAPMQAPLFPVIANATAEVVRDAETARSRLAAQLTSPVRWVEGVRVLAAEAGGAPRFVEIGPGTVLTGLAKRIVAGAETVNLDSAAEVRAFLEAA